MKHRINKKILKHLIYVAIICHFIANLLLTGGFLYVSRLNYPGANALIKLHELEPVNASKSNVTLTPSLKSKFSNIFLLI